MACFKCWYGKDFEPPPRLKLPNAEDNPACEPTMTDPGAIPKRAVTDPGPSPKRAGQQAVELDKAILRRLSVAAPKEAIVNVAAAHRVALQWQSSAKMHQSGRLQRSGSQLAIDISTYAEQDKGPSSPQRQQNESVLGQRLKKLKLKMEKMGDDGNCQFRSCAHHLYGDQKHHAKVRQHAITYMQTNSAMFEIFFETPGQFKSYVRNMAQLRTWGDELTLKAICDAYGVTIHVVQSTEDNWYLTYTPEEKKDPKQVFITYLSPVHYNALVDSSFMSRLSIKR
ncbi:hypothetical protein CYMTET_3276 [Cymbomonas tetramitiformis]|uniref:OTU domain-containing protein n=1 Tax=Cymbomonas tetramitiformis TaxID=36881 RepID=A0AAE0H3M2_9CHLO|nr:hypothetical protein CYMTET_3276 [Cymbomonas tetramitiformis]